MAEDESTLRPAQPVGVPHPGEEQLRAAREALAARDRLLAERGARLHALEDVADRLAVTTSRLGTVSAELAALHLARSAELAERDRRIADLEALLARRSRTVSDDLKRIKGIGPVIEARLHGVGITTFHQVAALEGESLQQVGDLLGIFRGRIRRDRWIEQAAELARAPDAAPPLPAPRDEHPTPLDGRDPLD